MPKNRHRIRLVPKVSPRKKKRTVTFHITAEQDDLLEELNKITRIPKARIIREGITEAIKMYASFLPKGLPKGFPIDDS
jgi:hypothetical protein